MYQMYLLHTKTIEKIVCVNSMFNSVQQKCNGKYNFTNGIQFSRLKTIEIVLISVNKWILMVTWNLHFTQCFWIWYHLYSIHFEVFYLNLLLQSFCHMISNILKIHPYWHLDIFMIFRSMLTVIEFCVSELTGSQKAFLKNQDFKIIIGIL